MDNTREYTNRLLERIEDGTLDRDTVIMAFCKYTSEDDVRDMMHVNEMLGEPCEVCESVEELSADALCDACQADADADDEQIADEGDEDDD